MKGIFITFEGIEGCGKSTQINRLVPFLTEQGYPMVKIKEPGGTRIGEGIRGILLDRENRNMAPYTELLLYLASRAQLISEVILPALKEGKVVLCDRFTDSTVAYQGYGRGFNIDRIEELNKLATEGVRPDLTILLDISVKKGLERIRKGGKTGEKDIEPVFQLALSWENDRIEAEELFFHERVREGYLKIAEEEPNRIRVIGADLPVEEIHKKIIEIVKEKFRWP